MKKKLICITGLDGVGKSTLIKSVQENYLSVYLANIWDLLNSETGGLPFKSKCEVDEFLCSLTPDSRLLFLAHAMKYSIDMAFKSNKKIILIDSYYYKYFAAELALGAKKELVSSLIGTFPKPDIVVELVLSVQEASCRKENYSRYECGLANNPARETFVAFQNKVFQEWLIFDRYHWHRVDAKQPIDKVVSDALKILT
jgi:thymidylate kinase